MTQSELETKTPGRTSTMCAGPNAPPGAAAAQECLGW